MERSGSFWPLLDLVVRTPRLELRLPREEEFPAIIELADRGPAASAGTDPAAPCASVWDVNGGSSGAGTTSR